MEIYHLKYCFEYKLYIIHQDFARKKMFLQRISLRLKLIVRLQFQMVCCHGDGANIRLILEYQPDPQNHF